MRPITKLLFSFIAISVFAIACEDKPENQTNNENNEAIDPGTADPGEKPGTGTEQPSTEQPGTEQPGTEQPGTEQPGTEQPGTEQPGTEQPGTEQPGTEQPGTEQPGTEQPGTEQPGTEQPGTEQPGTEQPGTEQPGTEQPGTEQPGTGETEEDITTNPNGDKYSHTKTDKVCPESVADGEIVCDGNEIYRCEDGFLYLALTCGDGRACNKDKCYEKCSEGDADKISCSTSQTYGDVIVNHSCSQATNGTWLYMPYGTIDVYCAHGCEGDGCHKIIDNEYTTCSAISDKPHCEGKLAINCESSKILATVCEADETCYVSKETDEAKCGKACDAKDVDKTTDSCKEKIALTSTCTLVSDGQYIEITQGAFCDHGCEDGKCIKLAPEEGDECDVFSTDGYCTGSTAINCSTLGLSATACADKCIVEDGVFAKKARCATACTEEEIKLGSYDICSDSGKFVETVTCVDASNGGMAKLTNSDYCDHGCVDNACIKLVEDEGESCKKYTFTGRCTDDNIAVACIASKIEAKQCADNQVCVTDHGDASCEDLCEESEIGKTTYRCDKDWEKTSLVTTCIRLNDGSGKYIKNEEEAQYCDHGCNSADGKCKKIHEEEYSSCENYRYKNRCSGNIALNCDIYSSTVEAEDCGDGICMMKDGEATCRPVCTDEEVTLGTFNMCSSYNAFAAYTCVEVSEDVYARIESGKSTICNHECVGGSCHMYSEDEGEPCHTDTFVERCDGNVKVTCDSWNDQVYASECFSSQKCQIIEGTAKCVSK